MTLPTPAIAARGIARALRLALGAALLGACHDDTPMAMKVIDGETDRLLYARTLREAAAAVDAGGTLEPTRLEAVDFAYLQSQEAYARILACEDDGPCRRASLRPLCADVAALLAARRSLAAQSELLGVAEQLSADKGPLTLERVRVLRAQVERDGRTTPLEEDVLALATAAAAAHAVYARTPAGAREAARHRATHAIDEFALRCEAK